jgi:HAD superfamily hydrolase (TIGR01509 family)
MPFELVIFDCDGVLVDSEGISNRILCDMLNELEVNYTLEETVKQFKGRSMQSCYEIIETERGKPMPPVFDRQFRVRTFDAFKKELKPIAGIHATLRNISIPVCVASSGPHEKIRHNLTLTDLLDKFDGRIFSASDVANGKPAPDLFLHAAKTLGVAPDRCAVVEDSPLGVRAGVAAGMTVFGYAADSDPDQLRLAGAHVFMNMSQLPGLLNGTDR